MTNITLPMAALLDAMTHDQLFALRNAVTERSEALMAARGRRDAMVELFQSLCTWSWNNHVLTRHPRDSANDDQLFGNYECSQKQWDNLMAKHNIHQVRQRWGGVSAFAVINRDTGKVVWFSYDAEDHKFAPGFGAYVQIASDSFGKDDKIIQYSIQLCFESKEFKVPLKWPKQK